MERKKFGIRTEEKRKFEIRPEPSPEWFRQGNENDCGPCLILNGLRRIRGVEHIPQNISEVRQEVNRLRREDGRAELQPNGWFTSEDMQRYLQDVVELDVKEYAGFADSIEEISRSIHTDLEQPFVMVYSTAGRHFRGIIPIENGYELLDSFNTGPEWTPPDALDDFIDRTIHNGTPERVERIGIVRTRRD